MAGANQRRKRRRYYKRIVSIFVSLFFALQLTVMPLVEAFAAQDSSMETEIFGYDGQDKEQNKGLGEGEKEYDDIAERDGDSLEYRNASAYPIPDTHDTQGVDNGGETGYEGDDSEAADKTGVFELTVETNEYVALLCFDEGRDFPDGSSFTVRHLTEEEEAYPEYCRLLFEAADVENMLIGFYTFAWEIPEDVCSEEELFLTLMLKDDAYSEREYRVYVYEEGRFATSENTEAEKNTVFFMSARQGLYALTAVEHKQDGLLPENASMDGLPYIDCTNREEKKQAGDSSMAVEEKEVLITAEEVIEEDNSETSLKRMMIKNPAAAAEENAETDLQFRGASASAETIQRNIYRIHLSAEGLTDSEADHVIVDIKDQNGEIRDTMTLSDENGWTADWEAADSICSSFSAEETGIYDSSGRDLTKEWECSVLTSERQQLKEPYYGWEPVSGFEIGTYTIAYEIEGIEYFLAAENPYQGSIKLGGTYKGWNLISEQAITDSSIWHVVETDKYGARITNEAIGNSAFLSARYLNSIVFAVFNTSSEVLRMVYDDGVLKAPAGNSYGFLQADARGIKCAETPGEATHVTLYRSVLYRDVVCESFVTFGHSEKPPHVQNTTARIKLMVGGNIGDRNREFSFTAAVNDRDPISFTLAHTEEFLLEDVPIGAKLTVRMETSDHVPRSSFGDSVEGESSLSVPSFPAEGGTILFQAKRETELNTGIHYGSRSVYLFVLTTAFVYEFCIQIFRLKSITISQDLKTWRKKKT